jgi:DNA-binding IclR family transcriptional regulator
MMDHPSIDPASGEGPLGGDDPMQRAGTVQSVTRAMQVLDAVIRAESSGRAARLVDIAAAAGLHKGTAHRLLQALQQGGWIERDSTGRRYRVGNSLFALASLAGASDRVRDLARPTLARLADLTGDTVYLFVRTGFEAICVDRVEGSFPIKSLAVNIGDRRPLGRGAAGLALLAALSDAEIAETLDHLLATRADMRGRGRDWFLAQIARMRTDGLGATDGLTPGVDGVSTAVFGPGPAPLCAISVVAIAERFPPARKASVVKLLRREAARFGRAFAPADMNETPTPSRRGSST